MLDLKISLLDHLLKTLNNTYLLIAKIKSF